VGCAASPPASARYGVRGPVVPPLADAVIGDDFAARTGSGAHDHEHVLQQASILRARPRAART
jgi:hypothetical protein